SRRGGSRLPRHPGQGTEDDHGGEEHGPGGPRSLEDQPEAGPHQEDRPERRRLGPEEPGEEALGGEEQEDAEARELQPLGDAPPGDAVHAASLRIERRTRAAPMPTRMSGHSTSKRAQWGQRI